VVVEEVTKQHAEAAEGVVGAEGDADGVPTIGELFHLDVEMRKTPESEASQRVREAMKRR
jgi:hypothetical protein